MDNLKYAGFWIRNLAMIIDAIMFIAVYFVLVAVFARDDIRVFWIYETLCILYYTLMDASKYQGSLGKYALGLKVTDLSANRIGILKSLIRYILAYCTAIPMLYYCLPFYDPEFTARLQNTDIPLDADTQSYLIKLGIWSIVAFIGGFLWFLPMAFTKQKTTVHDLLSKTRVIRVKSSHEA